MRWQSCEAPGLDSVVVIFSFAPIGRIKALAPLIGDLLGDFARPVLFVSQALPDPGNLADLAALGCHHYSFRGSACAIDSLVRYANGDTVIGRSPAEYVRLFADDPGTSVIVLLGEIGGTKEHEVAAMLTGLGKPLVALIVGRHVRPGSRFGHAGALVSEAADTAAAKEAALLQAGARLARSPAELARLVRESLAA